MEKESFSFRICILLTQYTAHPFTVVYYPVPRFTVYLQRRKYKRRNHQTSAYKKQNPQLQSFPCISNHSKKKNKLKVTLWTDFSSIRVELHFITLKILIHLTSTNCFLVWI